MTTQTDEWLTIRQAADRLGLSDLSVRRRIKDGRLAHRLVDGKYYVSLTAAPTAPPPAPPSESVPDPMTDQSADYSPEPAAPSRPPAEELAAVLPAVTELAERAGRSAALEERLRQLEGREAELQERLVVLATRNGWLESRLDEREQTIKLLEDSRHRRPWWRRLFG
jgi:excisionase family DNA binding protein